MKDPLSQGCFYTDSTDAGRGSVLVISNDAFNRVFGRALVLPVVDMEPRFAEVGSFCLPTGGGRAICIYMPTVVEAAGWTRTGRACAAEYRKAVAVFNTITEYEHGQRGRAAAEAVAMK